MVITCHLVVNKADRMNWSTREPKGGAISTEKIDKAIKEYCVELRGGGTDESPFVYRNFRVFLIHMKE